jgi:hypothetical protein
MEQYAKIACPRCGQYAMSSDMKYSESTGVGSFEYYLCGCGCRFGVQVIIEV